MIAGSPLAKGRCPEDRGVQKVKSVCIPGGVSITVKSEELKVKSE